MWGAFQAEGRAASLKGELDSEFLLISCSVLFSLFFFFSTSTFIYLYFRLCISAYLGDSAVEAGPWNDSCSFLLSERTPYAFWESKPFNPCGLVDENQLSMLNRQNLSKLRQCLQIIFNHISYCIKSYILFLKRRLSKLSKLANVRMSAWVFYILNDFY